MMSSPFQTRYSVSNANSKGAKGSIVSYLKGELRTVCTVMQFYTVSQQLQQTREEAICFCRLKLKLCCDWSWDTAGSRIGHRNKYIICHKGSAMSDQAPLEWNISHIRIALCLSFNSCGKNNHLSISSTSVAAVHTICCTTITSPSHSMGQ